MPSCKSRGAPWVTCRWLDFLQGGEIPRNHLYGYTGVLTVFTQAGVMKRRNLGRGLSPLQQRPQQALRSGGGQRLHDFVVELVNHYEINSCFRNDYKSWRRIWH